MKNNLRKYLSIVLALFMLVSIVPMGTFAADTEAVIGGTVYATLKEPFAAAEDGDV